MANTQPPRMDSGILEMWRKDGRLYAIAGFVAGVMLFPLLASLGGDQLVGFLQQLVPELVGIALTVFLIDRIIQRRDERNALTAFRQQLVKDAASTSNEVSQNAIYQLELNDWLRGDNGLLKGGRLRKANMRAAQLRKANLEGADLWMAQLNQSLLRKANLQRANLRRANLQKAKMRYVDLQDADLRKAKLQGANLGKANLRRTNLEEAEFDVSTILPDETDWRPDTDLSRFTNPDHPQFWRSNDLLSPAFRGWD